MSPKHKLEFQCKLIGEVAPFINFDFCNFCPFSRIFFGVIFELPSPRARKEGELREKVIVSQGRGAYSSSQRPHKYVH